uniref:C2H2-type domain-containing protein n=1 Tax=Bionectria ochroleuca TaxID=29856 RepID=A0A8H7NQI8_BIOOC
MILDPALDDYIDYSPLISEADDQKRSNESTDGCVFSRDAIDPRAGSPSTFLKSFDAVRDREGDRPASISPSSSHPTPSHLAVAYHTGATDSEHDKRIYDRTLSMVLEEFRLQRQTQFHTPYPLNGLVQSNEYSPVRFDKEDGVAASELPSCDKPNFREHSLYKDATIGSDQLYHCPWEGQADCNHSPTNTKCIYNKFVDTHLKPYRCKFDTCEEAQFASSTILLRHEKEAHAMHGHGENPYLCPHEGCGRSIPGNGFTRRWNLRDHIRRIHKEDGQPRKHSRANAGKRLQRRIRNKDGLLEKRKDAPTAETLAEGNTQTQCFGWDHHRKSLEEIVQRLGTTDEVERSNLLVAAEDQIYTLKFIAPEKKLEKN